MDLIRVLHVDDDPRFADVVAESPTTEDDRFVVETATSAADGHERLAEHNFDCLISDYDLPGRNGVEFLESIRETHPDLPFILFTDDGSEEVASEAISAGVTEYLQKTGGTERLATRVEDAAEAFRSEQHAAEPGCVQSLDRETDTVLGAIVDNLPLGILVEDSDRDVLMANDTLFDVLGIPHSAEDIIGRDCAAAAAEVSDQFADPEVFVHGIDERITEREQVHEELELADGRMVERYYVPYTAPEGAANLWLYRDITDRTERERALAELQQRTETLMRTTTIEETANTAVETAHEVLDADLSGCHLLVDDQNTLEAVAFLDAVREELGEPPAYVRQAEADTPSQLVWEAFERGEPLVIDDTSEYDGLAEATPARSGVIHPLGEYGVFIVSTTAVGAFDETEKALIEILATALTAALDRVEREQEVRRQNDRLDKFASVISHDLRNPLSVATGRLELARRECENDHLDDVADAHDRMADLIDDILTLAREGEQVVETESVDFAATLEECWQTVETADAALVVESRHALQADPGRFRQLLENLFRNAVEHAGRDVAVTVGDLDDGFYVADDGPGIPEDERDHVFEAGYSTAETGTGFGLNIAREIADAHGWDLRVTESAAGGARFEITGVDVVNA